MSIQGGEASNSIMRSAEAEIIVKDPTLLNMGGDTLPDEERPKEELVLHTGIPGPCLSREDSSRVVQFLNQLPYGVIDRSRELDGQVSCSTNPGIIRWEDGGLSVVSELRGDDEGRLAALEKRLHELAKQFQWEHTAQYPYPGWKPEKDSVMVKKAAGAYEKIYGKLPRVKAVHAGLECGNFKKALPKLQIVSLGPTIMDYHSPDERMDLGSFERHCNVMWELLTTL